MFPFMGTRTVSPRGRYGERPQRDSVWRYICKNTTCWPAKAHDVTTGVPQYKCRRENTSSAFSSSLTGLFETCRVNLVRVQFSNSTMASTSKAFRKCVDPCPRYLTPEDTHDCCVFCRAVVKSTFVESKTSPSPKRFESESSPSPKRFESESSPSPKRFESKSKSKSKWDSQNRERKKIFFKTTYLIIDNLCDTRDGISSILI